MESVFSVFFHYGPGLLPRQLLKMSVSFRVQPTLKNSEKTLNMISVNKQHWHEEDRESGVVLVASLFLIPLVVIMLALAIDVGIFFLHRSSMQQVADASTLAAVQRFQHFKTNVHDAPPSIVDFRDIKLIILAMFRAQATPVTSQSSDQESFISKGMRSINQEGMDVLSSGNVAFDYAGGDNSPGSLTRSCGLGSPYLNHPEHLSNCASFGNITVRVTRGVRCYDASVRYFCSLENLIGFDSDSWEWANAVELDMRADGISSFFSRAFLGVTTSSISIQSTSYLPLNPPICGHPSCTMVFNTSNFNELQGVCNQITGFI
jgi:hypothetical protein